MDMDMDNMNKRLNKFSNHLIPSDEFLKIGYETVDHIFHLLKSSEKFYVDRLKIVGCIEKRTAISVDPDFGLVVFINHQHPLLDVLNNFEVILKLTDEIKIIKVTKLSILFEVNNISFELFPATNFVTTNLQSSGIILATMQTLGAIEYIRNNRKDGYKYGKAISEQKVEFFKSFFQYQTPFVHEIVRLGKFWNKTLHLDTYISERSSLIEIIGIHAGRIQESRGEKSHFKGFMVFLELMTGFDSLAIFHLSPFYSEQQIPECIKIQRPLILDPVDPYNNLAWFYPSEKNKIVQSFLTFSRETLTRLNNKTKWDVLFEVQPKVIPGPRPDNYFVSTHDEQVIIPTIQVREIDPEFNCMNWFEKGKVIQLCLLTSLQALTLGGKYLNDAAVRARVEACIVVNILGKPAPTKGFDNSKSANHEDYKLILEFPFPNEPKRCVKVSFS